MPDIGSRMVANRDSAWSGKDSRKIPQDCPELTEEVAQADIPVLDRQLPDNTVEDRLPTLEETVSLPE